MKHVGYHDSCDSHSGLFQTSLVDCALCRCVRVIHVGGHSPRGGFQLVEAAESISNIPQSLSLEDKWLSQVGVCVCGPCECNRNIQITVKFKMLETIYCGTILSQVTYHNLRVIICHG